MVGSVCALLSNRAFKSSLALIISSMSHRGVRSLENFLLGIKSSYLKSLCHMFGTKMLRTLMMGLRVV